jgi:hypothetical protein
MYGINSSGQVAGTGSPSGSSQAFIGTTAGATPVPLPSGWTSTSAAAINDSGQVAGTGSNGSFIGSVSGSSAIAIPSGWSELQTLAVSSTGQAAGFGFNGSVIQAFIGNPSSTSGIPILSGYIVSHGYAVNAAGQVAGYVTNGVSGDFRPFIGTAGYGSSPIPLPPGWTQAAAYALNSSAQVAGSGTNASGFQQAFFGTTGGSLAIPLPTGATMLTRPNVGITDSGFVVGTSDAGGWIWSASDGTLLLSNLVPGGWVIQGAIGISSNGMILAVGSLNGGAGVYVELAPSTCTLTLNPTSVNLNASGGSSSFGVTTGTGCTWTATSNSSFVSITSGTSGSGNGTVNFNVTANGGAQPLVGTITVDGPVAGAVFTVNEASGAPTPPTLVSPANGAIGVALAPTLTWNTSAGAASYSVYFGTEPSPPLINNVATTSYSPGTLVAGVTYYWQIVAMNGGGTGASSVWSFTTSSAASVMPTSVSPGSGSALTQTFTFTFTDPNGYSDLSVLDVIVNNYLDGIGACYFAWVPASATSGYLYLVDDAGDGGYASGSPMFVPTSNSVQNSQCTINGPGSSVSSSGNTLTLTLSITFKAAFAGNKIFYMAARSNTQNSGWQALGTWNVPGSAPTGPFVGGTSPGRSTSMGQNYTFTFTDTNGYADLNVLDILTNSFLDGISACYVAYVPTGATTGYLYLVDDGGDGGYAAGSPMLLSSGGTLQNNQCTINTVGSSASASGNTLNLTLNMTFKTGFAGNQVFYLASRNSGSGNSGWQPVGSVTVP